MSSRVQDIDQHPSLTKDFHPAESDYDNKKAFSDASKSETNSLYDLSTVAALAPADQKAPTAGGWILQKLGLRSKDRLTDLDAVRFDFPFLLPCSSADLLLSHRSLQGRASSTVLSAPSIATKSTPSGRTLRRLTHLSAGHTAKRLPSSARSTGRSSHGFW